MAYRIGLDYLCKHQIEVFRLHGDSLSKSIPMILRHSFDLLRLLETQFEARLRIHHQLVGLIHGVITSFPAT